MALPPGTASPLFLREAEVRRGIELMFFAHARLFGALDARLAEARLGRAHHRAMHFVARSPDIPVGTLLALLGITKQALGRVVGELVERDLIETRTGRDDRRQRLLRLTAEGKALEAQLFEILRATMAKAYGEAGPGAVGGFWQVLDGLVSPAARRTIDEAWDG